LPNSNWISVVINSSGNAMLATDGIYLYYSVNYGITWGRNQLKIISNNILMSISGNGTSLTITNKSNIIYTCNLPINFNSV